MPGTALYMMHVSAATGVAAISEARAKGLPIYGESQIETPHLDRLAREGVVFTNAIATCPVCTPYRAMLLTGRHPQTTGHVINFVRTRHDEISIGDAFSRAGYRAAWIGKEITVRLERETLKGVFKALDRDGALILLHNGEERRITAGDVFV